MRVLESHPAWVQGLTSGAVPLTVDRLHLKDVVVLHALRADGFRPTVHTCKRYIKTPRVASITFYVVVEGSVSSAPPSHIVIPGYGLL